jgi:hypothetical protein
MSNIIFENDEEYKTWTVTFSESVENHVGMEQIGKMSNRGLFMEDMENIKKKFDLDIF